MKILQEHDNFKLLFIDIVKGSSYCHQSKLYIKHTSDFELAEFILKKDIYVIEELSSSSLSEESKLGLLKEHGLWGDKEEDERLSLEMTISSNKGLVEKMSVPSQKEMINGIIKQKEAELEVLQNKKDELIGSTREYYGTKFMSELLIKGSFFKDRECKIPAFSDEEFENLENEKMHFFNLCYHSFLDKFSQRTMRSLAVLPFFLNQLCYCKENLTILLGKPVAQFSHFQFDLISKGLRNLNVIENAETDPPEVESSTDFQELLDWYDLNYSVLLGKSKSGSDSIGVTKSKSYVKPHK